MKTIRELREEAGLTQVQLSVKLNVTPGAVYAWESGRSEPRASQLRAIARLFDVCMDEIDFELEEAKSAA
jgi:transcriptional regulator with XRE-family HTH domain